MKAVRFFAPLTSLFLLSCLGTESEETDAPVEGSSDESAHIAFIVSQSAEGFPITGEMGGD